MKRQLVRRYAQALFRLAEERAVLYEVESELTLVEQVFAAPAVPVFFENPGVTAAVKKETIGRLFGKRISVLVHNFLCHVTDKRRSAVLLDIIAAYRLLVKQANQIAAVQVTTAMPLQPREHEQLLARLVQVTGKDIELEMVVEPRILGGIILRVGDKRIDSSIVGRLAAVKRHMLNKSLGGK